MSGQSRRAMGWGGYTRVAALPVSTAQTVVSTSGIALAAVHLDNPSTAVAALTLYDAPTSTGAVFAVIRAPAGEGRSVNFGGVSLSALSLSGSTGASATLQHST